ncbi:hypothetical protein ZWY2020_002015 [Hordeum vulgare]|nr:hypothetical protein ZWY2020_002015 [Hordeum vulgare]
MAQRSPDALADQPDVSPVSLDPSLAPLLLFDRGDDTVFFYSIPKGKLLSRSRRAAGLAGHRYWVTPQGWLLMLHLESRDTFLWNPWSLERIGLHTNQDNLLDGLGLGDSRCLLSWRPSSHASYDADCVVLLLDREKNVFYYCRPGPGGSRWLKQAHEHDYLTNSSCLAVATAGETFCSYEISQIVTLEFSPNPTFTTHDLLEDRVMPTVYSMCTNVVLEHRAELFSLVFCHPVRSCRRVMQIVVRKLDLSTGAWLTVDTLGDAVFLVDCTRRYGVSFDARQVDGLGKGNHIYFLTYDDKALYVYDIERGTTVMHDPGLNLHDSHVPEFVMPLV